MRAAPAVDAALAPGRIERMVITLLYGMAGAVLALWAVGHAQAWAGAPVTVPPWLASVLAALATALPGAALSRRVLPAAPARLAWDGTAWQLRTAGPTPLRRLVVALDLGTWILLKAFPADGGTVAWRVASARSAGADWHALRVALQAHAGAPQAPADGPGAKR
jgi:hypothetical protein